MDSGRKALLEKAREFGSLAKNWSIDEFLERTVTYRTLAFYLGIQSEWWDEFWRSFSFALGQVQETKVKSFHFCCKAREAPFLLFFLSCWFGKGTRIADVSERDLFQAYRLLMREGRDGRDNTKRSR